MSSKPRVVFGCAVALLIAGCGAPHLPASAPQQVTALGGPTLAGKVVSITSFHGHPVVLIFWASWCGPCHDEQRALNTAYATWSPRGVVFLGIDLRDTTAPALAFEREFNVPYPSIADTNATLAVDYRIPSAPALVFLNTQGKVADVVLGGLGTMSVAAFNAEISTLLGTSKTGSA
ncbi:MAG: TlpA family protein disulfide reductase [Candidatus Dormibacteria bacterium]